jgi:hypothetical protein
VIAEKARLNSSAALAMERTLSMSVRQAAIVLSVPRSVLHRARLSRTPRQNDHQISA